MAKYSFEFKKKIVTEYLEGKGGRNHWINKKKIQRIVQKLGLQVTSFTRKNRK